MSLLSFTDLVSQRVHLCLGLLVMYKVTNFALCDTLSQVSQCL